MEKNFLITRTSVEISYHGKVYDLHNCYKFNGISLISHIETKLEIHFDKMEEDWVKVDDPKQITFVFHGVKYLEFSKLFFLEESTTIEELGYKDPQDNDYNWLMCEEHFTGQQHFIFRFEDEEYARVWAEKIELITEY